VTKAWARHTPNGEIALTMVAFGIALIFLAAIPAVTVL
jgi:high-affinity K+ transport system ATPase subunit B